MHIGDELRQLFVVPGILSVIIDMVFGMDLLRVPVEMMVYRLIARALGDSLA